MDIKRLIKDYKINLKKNKSPIRLSIIEKIFIILLIAFCSIAIFLAVIIIITKSKIISFFLLLFSILLVVLVVLMRIYINYQEKNNKAKLTKLRQEYRDKKVLSVMEALKSQNIDVKNKNVLLIVYNDLNFKSTKNTSIYSLFWDCIKNIILPLLISLVGIYAGFDGSNGVFTFVIVIAFCLAFLLAAIPVTTSIYDILNKKKILLNEICDIIFKYIISKNQHKNCKIKKIKKSKNNTRKKNIK